MIQTLQSGPPKKILSILLLGHECHYHLSRYECVLLSLSLSLQNQAPSAVISIPELEFEIGADQKRHIDTIYNHIGAAILNLGRYVAQASPGTY